MSGYIDSEKLKDNVKRYLEKLASHQKIPIYKPIIREISNDICFAIDMLSVDAVEVVRCKDCKFLSHFTDGHLECRLLHDLRPVPCTYVRMQENGFCSYGERREVTE